MLGRVKAALAGSLALMILPSQIGASSSDPFLYKKFGWAMTELGVPRVQANGTGNMLLLAAYHGSHLRGSFVVTSLRSGNYAKAQSVWAVGANQDDPDSLDLAGDRTRMVSEADAERLMSSVAMMATRRPSEIDICLHGPVYPYIMRRGGVLTHGVLNYCGYPDTNQFVCEVVTGEGCAIDRPVYRAKS